MKQDFSIEEAVTTIIEVLQKQFNELKFDFESLGNLILNRQKHTYLKYKDKETFKAHAYCVLSQNARKFFRNNRGNFNFGDHDVAEWVSCLFTDEKPVSKFSNWCNKNPAIVNFVVSCLTSLIPTLTFVFNK